MESRTDFERQPGFDHITFTFSENSNYASLLQVHFPANNLNFQGEGDGFKHKSFLLYVCQISRCNNSFLRFNDRKLKRRTDFWKSKQISFLTQNYEHTSIFLQKIFNHQMNPPYQYFFEWKFLAIKFTKGQQISKYETENIIFSKNSRLKIAKFYHTAFFSHYQEVKLTQIIDIHKEF